MTVPSPPAGAAGAGASPMGRLPDEWQRLHPLSPLVRAGRGAIGLIAVLGLSLISNGGSRSGDLLHLALLAIVAVAGVVSWLVTRWRVEGNVLLVDSGLIRRSSDRFPLAQVQAIDIVRPGLARLFGLSELRIRLAGGPGRAGRLAYLTEREAEHLRARLLALAHGVAEDTPPPAEQVVLTVPTDQLVVSLLLSGLVLAFWLVALLVALALVAPTGVAVGLGAGMVGIFAGVVIRRFNGGYHLTVAEAPDGLRLRSGLVETSAETIPWGRVQAIRMIEPVAWRALGWCRLEVEVARGKSRGRQDRNQSNATRALLPVGDRQQAAWLVARLLAVEPTEQLPPPARARWKSPLRFHYLTWGVNDSYAVTTSGRLHRVTNWVPLAKVQSIRHVEGPVQRRLGLGSVHLDTAGRRIHAVARDRDRAESTRIMDDLPARCRQARELERASRGAASGQSAR